MNIAILDALTSMQKLFYLKSEIEREEKQKDTVLIDEEQQMQSIDEAEIKVKNLNCSLKKAFKKLRDVDITKIGYKTYRELSTDIERIMNEIDKHQNCIAKKNRRLEALKEKISSLNNNINSKNKAIQKEIIVLKRFIDSEEMYQLNLNIKEFLAIYADIINQEFFTLTKKIGKNVIDIFQNDNGFNSDVALNLMNILLNLYQNCENLVIINNNLKEDEGDLKGLTIDFFISFYNCLTRLNNNMDIEEDLSNKCNYYYENLVVSFNLWNTYQNIFAYENDLVNNTRALLLKK